MIFRRYCRNADPNQRSIAEIFDRIRRLGVMVGAAEREEALADKLEAVRARVARLPAPVPIISTSTGALIMLPFPPTALRLGDARLRWPLGKRKPIG